MSAPRMHDGEVHTDVALVQRLLAAQFPHWAALPVAPVMSDGTDNGIYRLGMDMAVRLPRHPGAVAPLEKEREWLPRLAPHLPLAVPLPLAQGLPGEGFPWRWTVCRWTKGRNPRRGQLADPVQMARDLAGFITRLQRIDAQGGPAPGAHNFWRGVPLIKRDGFTRKAIAESEELIDARAVTAAWEADMGAPAWRDAPVWVHGDLSAGNLLVLEDRLSAVIDFGGLGVDDPACDLIVAWSLFSGEARAAFRDALAVDDAMWARGRGWALSTAVVALPYYRSSSPAIADGARHVIAEVLGEHEG